jgi:hypothetical protein
MQGIGGGSPAALQDATFGEQGLFFMTQGLLRCALG